MLTEAKKKETKESCPLNYSDELLQCFWKRRRRMRNILIVFAFYIANEHS